MRVRAWQEKLPLRKPFVISTGTLTAAEVVFVEVEHEGLRGVGEAAPSLRVAGETPAGVRAFIEVVAERWSREEPSDWKRVLDDLAAGSFGNPAAKAALETALLDLVGRKEGKPLHALLGLRPASKPTSATVVLDTPEAMAREARSHAEQGFSRLKLKLGDARRDLARVRAVRDAVPEAVLRCDANTAWTERQALRLVEGLDKLEVELLEQPVPRGRWASMRRIAKRASLPLLADEDVLGAEDLRALVGQRYADGFVLKLMKCGGPWQAKRMLDVARREGLRVLVSCMVESGLAIGAAAHLLARVEWADLDGAWLLAHDPWTGSEVAGGVVASPRGAGVGVQPRAGSRPGS